jgi:alpha-L-rhamnosidase
MKNLIVLSLIILISISLNAQNLPAPSGLLCELLREPSEAVITDSTPEFTWIFPQSGVNQSAYQILVASSPYLLKEGKADLWDSKKISNNNSVNISYAGKALKDNHIYWWVVKVWSTTGLESSYSEPQQFNTGTFDRSHVSYPGESKWIELTSNNWVSEDKQRASFENFEPTNISRSEKGDYFVEFEKSVIGILEFTATTEKDNTPISVHLGERRNDDQTVNKEPGRSNIGYQQIDMLLKKGTHHYIVKLADRKKSGYLHTQKLAPHYPDVIPFKYVEITGNIKEFAVSEFKQAALFYYFDDSATDFVCSDENLKVVWDLCKYTQKSTPFLGVYADGNRERMPYEADAYIQMLSHFASDREYSIAKYTINFLLDHASWPTEWQLHMVLMAWEYYMQTGDKSLLVDRYEDIKRKSLIAFTDDNGLISTRTGKKTEEFLRTLNFPGKTDQFRDIVDWPQGAKKGDKKPAGHQSPFAGGETDNYVFTDYNTVVNAFHNRCLVIMAKIAEVVGNDNDAQFFEQRAIEHKAAFLATFFDTEKGYFVDGESTDHSSLHANMYPLAFNMVPEENIASVAKFIKSRGMACSVYGSQQLLESLYNAGEADYALSLMTSDDKRSWLNMIRVGSSMTTEAWDESFKPNLTWNHAWGSAPANITARKLMGIEPIEPSFSKFRISPQPGSLEKASIKVPSIRGSIACSLVNHKNSWEMEVSIPGNTEAEIWLPAEFTKVVLNGEEIKASGTKQFARGKRNIFKVKSGIYNISATK